MPTPYATEKERAYHAIVRAAALCRQVQQEMVRPASLEKSDRSPVTVADYASQAVICKELADAFPGDPVVAEETSEGLRTPDQARMLEQVVYFTQATLPAATPAAVCNWLDHGGAEPGGRCWTLDPIDGTKGFLRGEQYAVALALIVDGCVQVGALACPNLPLDLSLSDGPRGVVFLAVRNQGAEMLWLDDARSARPIAVASVDAPSAARFVESFESGHTDHATHQALARTLGITQPSVRFDSQAKYGAVARGDAAIYLRLPSPRSPDYRERIWDHAAGALIVEEAGGRVTDALGAQLDFSQGRRLEQNRGIVASNAHLHPAVLEAIGQLPI